MVRARGFAGQMSDFFPGSPIIFYCISGAILVLFWIYALVGKKKA